MANNTTPPKENNIEPIQDIQKQQNPLPGQVPPQKPIDPVEQAKILERQLRYNEAAAKMSQLLTKITIYPIDLSYTDFLKTKKDLITVYNEGDFVVKGILIVEINERLSHIESCKDFINAIKLSEKLNRQIDMKDIINKIYDSSYSLEGSIEMLKILEEIDDERSLKLLSNYLTKYLNQGSPLFRTLIIYTIRLFGRSKNPFSIQLLLNLIETGSVPDYLYNDINVSVEDWNSKLPKLKIDPEQKKDIKERIIKVVDPLKKGTKHYE